MMGHWDDARCHRQIGLLASVPRPPPVIEPLIELDPTHPTTTTTESAQFSPHQHKQGCGIVLFSGIDSTGPGQSANAPTTINAQGKPATKTLRRLLSSSTAQQQPMEDREELETSVLNSSRRASTSSDLGQGGVGDEGEDHIRVICRCGLLVVGSIRVGGGGCWGGCAGSRARRGPIDQSIGRSVDPGPDQSVD